MLTRFPSSNGLELECEPCSYLIEVFDLEVSLLKRLVLCVVFCTLHIL